MSKKSKVSVGFRTTEDKNETPTEDWDVYPTHLYMPKDYWTVSTSADEVKKENKKEKMKVTDFIVEPVERRVISKFIEKHHYSHSVNGVQHIQCFAMFREGKFGFDKEMIGAAMYCYPSMPSTAKKYNPINPDRCWELRRLVCIDDTPKNTESYFISQCHKWTKQNTDIEVIVSFADLEEGHSGVIYKASNFHFYGQTGGGSKLMVDGVLRHNRSLNQSKRTFGRTLKRRYQAGDPDVYQVKTKPKNIYVYYLNKKIKKKLMK